MKPGAYIQADQKAAAQSPRRAVQPADVFTTYLKRLFQAALLGCVYALLSTPAAYTANDNTLAAIIWPAPAIAAALLWRMPWRQWGPFLLAVFLAMVYVGNFDALSLGADSAFALLNVLQVALYSWVGRRFVSERGDIDTTRRLARFMLLLPLLGTAAVAALGASIGMLTKHTLWLEEWRVMMVGNGLAILVLLPALLAWCPADRLAQLRDPSADSPWTPAIAAALTALLLLCAALLRGFPAEVLRALLSLVLVWAAIHGGLRAAASGVLAAATAGIGLTFMKLGPYALPPRQDGIWELQLDLAGLAVLSFFVAISVYERQKLNLRLDRARRFESMGLLAGGIAHDFNNILGAVGGYTELANEQLNAGSAAQASLREVSLAVARGKDLTEQILLAGRRGERARELIDFRDAVIQSAALARPLLPPGVQMTLSLPATGVCILAHQGQLVRALLNLMRNASQAAASKVTVTLSVAQAEVAAVAGADHLIGEALDESCAWADVTDDGAGIPPAHIHQLFDPFFSSRAAGSGQGTGLGLAIVAGVATDHAGGVAVWSGHGAATRFRLMLPLAPDGMQAPDETPAALPGQGQSVLLLEPDASRRERSEDCLAALGFEPAGYGREEDALAALEQSPGGFFLLVTDWSAADGRGEALLQKIRHIAPALPVIACSRDADAAGISQTAGLVSLPAVHDCAMLHKAVTIATGAARGPGPQHLPADPSL